MSYSDSMKRLIQRNSIDSLFSPQVYNKETGFYLLDDGNIGFGFEFQPLLGGSDIIASQLSDIFNRWLPDNCVLNIGTFPMVNTEPYERFYEEKRISNKESSKRTELLEAYVDSRKDFLRKASLEGIPNMNGKKPRSTSCYLSMTIPIPTKNSEVNEAFNKKILELRKSFLSFLEGANFYPEALTPKKLINIYNIILNTNPNAQWRTKCALYDETININEQLADADTQFHRSESSEDWVGSPNNKRYIKALTVKKFPDFHSIAENSKMIFRQLSTDGKGIPGECIVNASFYFPNKKSEGRRIRLKTMWTKNMRSASKLRAILGNIADGYELLNDSIGQNNAPVKVCFSIINFGSSEAEVQENSSITEGYYSSLGFQMLSERILVTPLFLSSLPFGQDPKSIGFLARHKSLSAKEAPHFLPAFSDWKGSGMPIMQFFGRSGEIASFDFFKTSASMNSIITAESGSGKSFLAQAIINSYQAFENALVYVIDMSDSYEKMTQEYDGKYLDFQLSDSYYLNPFETVIDINEEIDIVAGVIFAMMENNDRLSDIQNAELKIIIKKAWDLKQTKANTDLVYELILAHEEKDIQKLAVLLHAFTSEGSYARFIYGEKKITFSDNTLNVAQLKNLGESAQLQKVVLYQIMSEIKKAMILSDNDPKIKGRKKILMIDESWAILAGKVGASSGAADFIRAMYRVARKHNGSVSILTQSLMDIFGEDDASRTIYENSPFKLTLSQQIGTINDIYARGLLSEDPYERKLLESIHTIKKKYSEIYIQTPFGNGVVRFVTDRFTQLLYTTDGEEKNKIEHYQSQGLSRVESIKSVVKDESSTYL